MPSKTIAVIGGLDADLIMITSRIPDPGESVLASHFEESLGGKGANSAIATFRTCHDKFSQKHVFLDFKGASGDIEDAHSASQSHAAVTKQEINTGSDAEIIRVKMIGAVGDDEYGEKFIAELSKNGVDVSGIITVPDTRSSICFVTVDDLTRENRCLFTQGATATWKEKDFLKPEQLGGGIRPDLVIAQMEIDEHVVETMLETAGNASIDFCLNAAPASPIDKHLYRHVTHLLMNESEAAIMSGRDRDEVKQDTWLTIAKEFLNSGVANVVITLGAKGAFYANAEGNGHCPAYDVKVEDTTGAGDTFTGAYASDYLRQKDKGTWDIRSAVVRANKAAAITIQGLGA
ncbi:hypothetical protein FPOA_03518 [Fusarium poae]|uniref:Ribokinase n=1 Tax=Fusarium poae TaxID=36050 RepID=A0A1B8BA31_FUSPO|nr:hypothetical protein FPOA_03518 [Fusarium poae]